MASSISCQACKTDNDPWRKHCGGCGSGLPGACGGCGAVNGPSDRFCGGCAKRLRAQTKAHKPVDATMPIDVITDVLP